MDDSELVRSIVNGHPADFRILVSKYKNLVSHVIYRLISDPKEKEDLGQEIFIKIYQALPGFEFRSSLATWISRIAYNYCVNYLRRNKMPDQLFAVYNNRRQSHNSAGVEASMETICSTAQPPDETLIENEIYSFLDNEINSLPIIYRTIITFFYLDNKSHMEIADIMDLPIGTVKGYLFRARKLLKDRLLSNYDMEDICP